jgi:hypothetical protein
MLARSFFYLYFLGFKGVFWCLGMSDMPDAVFGPGVTGCGEKDQNVDYHSHDETHERDQMLNDKNFVTQISDRSNGADCYPEKN